MLKLRFTPLGVDDVLEDVQRMYVQDSIRNLKVKNKTKDNAPVPKEYLNIIAGTTCLEDHHEAHQGPGLSLAVCTQYAAMISKRPDYIDCAVIDNVIRIGTLVYESYQNVNTNRKTITSPQLFLDEHEHLKQSLNVISEEHVICPKRIDPSSKNIAISGDFKRNNKSSESSSNRNTNTSSDLLTENDNNEQREGGEEEEEEHPFDTELERVVDGHVIEAATVVKKMMALTKAAHNGNHSKKTRPNRRDSAKIFASTVTSAASSLLLSNTFGVGGSSGNIDLYDETTTNRSLRSNIYMGIFCTDQLSLAVVVIQGKSGSSDNFLVFDPMRRDGKTDGSGIFETNSASIGYFEQIKQVSSFIARRFANLDVTQFSFTIVTTNDATSTTSIPTKPTTLNGDTKMNDDNDTILRRLEIEKANIKKLKLREKLISSRRRSVFERHLLLKNSKNDLTLQSFKHWRTLYLSLFQALWHLPSFRYHFCRGRKVPTNGRPVNCVVAAVWTFLTKFDTKASPVYGCPPPHYASSLKERQREQRREQLQKQHKKKNSNNRMNNTSYNNNNNGAGGGSSSQGRHISSKKLSQIKEFRSFLKGGEEVDNDLTNLHQNLDNLDLSHLDPGHILQYILQSTHCACTGTHSAGAGDPHTPCNCFEPPHVNPIIPISGDGFGALGHMEPSYPEDCTPGRRECVGHSVFHIDIIEKRECLHCGAKDHSSESTCINRYLNFVHRVNAERLVQQHTLMTVEYKSRVNRENYYNTNNSSSGSSSSPLLGQHQVKLDQVLRRIIDVRWQRACPKKPLCECCMGRVATTSCLTCDTKHVSEEYFQTRNRGRERAKKLRAEGKEGDIGGSDNDDNTAQIDGDGGGGPGSIIVEGGLAISNDSNSAELLEHYERNLSERHSVHLCFQCDRYLHRMSTKFGIQSFQGEELPTKDYRGKIIYCSSCQTGNQSHQNSNDAGGGSISNQNGIRRDGTKGNGLQKMYKTDGPVQTTETFESESGFRTNKVNKQLYLCERCYDMDLFPPLTKRYQFTEEHENSQFRSLLKKRLMMEYSKQAQKLKSKQEQTLCQFDTELDRLRRKLSALKIGSGSGTSLMSSAKLHQQANQINQLSIQIANLEQKRIAQIKFYMEQKTRRMSRTRRQVNRKLNAMLKSRRNVMSLTASHVRNKLPQTKKVSSDVEPCPIGSSVKVELRNAPSIYTLAIDWPTACPSGPDIQLTMELITSPFNLAHVYHSIRPTTSSPVSGTWNTLLMLFLRSTTSLRLLEIIQEMTAHAFTKSVPKSFPNWLSGAAFVKSGGRVGRASKHVQQLVDADRHRHFMAAEQARHRDNVSKVSNGGNSSYGGSGGFQPLKEDDDEHDVDYYEDDLLHENDFLEENSGIKDSRLSDSILERWRTKVAQDENGACWDHSSSMAYDVLWRKVHNSIMCGENHNTSHIKENMEYRVKSIVCRRPNSDVELTTSNSSQDSSKNASAKHNISMRRSGLPVEIASSPAASSIANTLGSADLNQYHEHEIAELQLHTTYSYDGTHKGKSQWCQVNNVGDIEYYSTHMLITKMRRETEYPILVFFEKVLLEADGGAWSGKSSRNSREGKSFKNHSNSTSSNAVAIEKKVTLTGLTGASGDSAISRKNFFGKDALSSKTELVNSALGIHPMDGGSMCFDRDRLLKDRDMLMKKYLSTTKKVMIEKQQQDSGKGGHLQGFEDSRHGDREQCCSIQ